MCFSKNERRDSNVRNQVSPKVSLKVAQEFEAYLNCLITESDPACKKVPLRGKLLFTFGLLFVSVFLMIASIIINGGHVPLNQNPMLGPSLDTIILMGGLRNSYIRSGQWWRLFWAGYLHAGWFHIAMNFLMWHQLGAMLEPDWGFTRTVIVFNTSVLSGNLLSTTLDATHVSVGASGGMFGMLGACVPYIIEYWHSISNPKLLTCSIFSSIFIGLACGFLPYVDNYAHIGGTIGGILGGFMIIGKIEFGTSEPRLKRYPLRQIVATPQTFAVADKLVENYGQITTNEVLKQNPSYSAYERHRNASIRTCDFFDTAIPDTDNTSTNDAINETENVSFDTDKTENQRLDNHNEESIISRSNSHNSIVKSKSIFSYSNARNDIAVSQDFSEGLHTNNESTSSVDYTDENKHDGKKVTPCNIDNNQLENNLSTIRSSCDNMISKDNAFSNIKEHKNNNDPDRHVPMNLNQPTKYNIYNKNKSIEQNHSIKVTNHLVVEPKSTVKAMSTNNNNKHYKRFFCCNFRNLSNYNSHNNPHRNTIRTKRNDYVDDSFRWKDKKVWTVRGLAAIVLLTYFFILSYYLFICPTCYTPPGQLIDQMMSKKLPVNASAHRTKKHHQRNNTKSLAGLDDQEVLLRGSKVLSDVNFEDLPKPPQDLQMYY